MIGSNTKGSSYRSKRIPQVKFKKKRQLVTRTEAFAFTGYLKDAVKSHPMIINVSPNDKYEELKGFKVMDTSSNGTPLDFTITVENENGDGSDFNTKIINECTYGKSGMKKTKCFAYIPSKDRFKARVSNASIKYSQQYRISKAEENELVKNGKMEFMKKYKNRDPKQYVKAVIGAASKLNTNSFEIDPEHDIIKRGSSNKQYVQLKVESKPNMCEFINMLIDNKKPKDLELEMEQYENFKSAAKEITNSSIGLIKKLKINISPVIPQGNDNGDSFKKHITEMYEQKPTFMNLYIEFGITTLTT